MKWRNFLRNFLRNIRIKYRLVVSDSETFEEKFAFKLTGMTLFVVVWAGAALLITGTIVLIAFTPLREYIPGYADEKLMQTSYHNEIATDSLSMELERQAAMIANLQRVLTGESLPSLLPTDTSEQKLGNYDTITLHRIPQDALLREQVEESMSLPKKQTLKRDNTPIPFFQTPVRGKIIKEFDRHNHHYGVLVSSMAGTPVLAVSDGTVLSAGWNILFENTLILVHAEGIISVYRGCSALFKETGDYVKVGEPIGIVGHAEKYSTGYSLHFELWYGGIPADPQEYLLFE